MTQSFYLDRCSPLRRVAELLKKIKPSYPMPDECRSVKRPLDVPGPVAGAIGRNAITGLGNFTVWSQTVVRVDAPKVAGVGRRHSRVDIGLDKKAFPTQMRT